MKNHLYISDLDGTLLNNQGGLSPYTMAGLEEILVRGIPFTVASARNIVSIKLALGDLPITLPVISGNGAYISDFSAETHHSIQVIEQEIARALLSLIEGYGLVPFVASYNGKDNLSYLDVPMNPGMMWYLNERKEVRDRRLRRLSNLKDALTEKVVCFTVIDKYPVLSELQEKIRTLCDSEVEVSIMDNMYFADWHWLLVHEARAKKEEAVKRLSAMTGYELEDITVFGDNTNDLGMYSTAGRGIAVSNGLPEIKEAASLIIGSNEEDSVVNFILEENGFGPLGPLCPECG